MLFIVCRGVARILPEVRTVFQISLSLPYPPPPNSKFDRQKHSHRRNHPLSTAKTGLGENNLLTFYTIPLAISIQDSNENRFSDLAEKSLLFWKPTFGYQNKKKQTVRYFRKNTPKNQTELNAIEAIYIVVVVVFIFTLSF